MCVRVVVQVAYSQSTTAPAESKAVVCSSVQCSSAADASRRTDRSLAATVHAAGGLARLWIVGSQGTLLLRACPSMPPLPHTHNPGLTLS